MTDNPQPSASHSHPGSSRGMWTIVAIFAVGLTVLVGLFLSPRSKAPAVPAGLAATMPTKSLVGVLMDCRPLGASPDAVIAAIKQLSASPDLLLLVDIESPLVPTVVEAFGMQPSYHAELFQRAQPNREGGERIGLCILSRHALFEGSPIRVDRRTVGVETVLAVDGSALHVRCIALDDVLPPPGPTNHPKALGSGGSPIVLTAGRLAGEWKVMLEAGRQPAGEVVELTRQQSPVAVSFALRRR